MGRLLIVVLPGFRFLCAHVPKQGQSSTAVGCQQPYILQEDNNPEHQL